MLRRVFSWKRIERGTRGKRLRRPRTLSRITKKLISIEVMTGRSESKSISLRMICYIKSKGLTLYARVRDWLDLREIF